MSERKYRASINNAVSGHVVLSTITEQELKTYGDGRYISSHSEYLHYLHVSGQAAATICEKAGYIAEDKFLAVGRNPTRIPVRPINVLTELSWLLDNELFRN
jgi:hypothetical protein